MRTRRVKAKKVMREAVERARQVRALERRHRAGYVKFPPDEFEVWDRVTVWPRGR